MTTVPLGPVVVVLGPGSPSPARIVRAAMPYGVVFAGMRDALGDSTTALAASLAPLVDIDPAGPCTAGPALSSYRPAGITTFSESALTATAELAAVLALPYHSAETVARLTSKHLQRARLAEAGVGRTRSVAVTSRAALDAALTGEPAVVKPLRGEGSLDTHLVRWPEDVPGDLPVSASRPFVVEEYLAGRDEYPFGDYVSVETASVDGQAHVLGVTGKLAQLPPFREVSQFVPSRLDQAEERSVADLAARAVSALGVARGLAHTEIKLTPEGPRVIEVNGRLGGHVDELYARAYGLDLLAIEFALATGTTSPALHHGPAGQVCYQYYNLAPAEGGAFIRVDGAAAVRAMPGVAAYRPFVARGALVPRGVSTARLDLLTGQADNHGAMLASIDKALAELTFTIADDSAPRAWRPSREGLRCLG